MTLYKSPDNQVWDIDPAFDHLLPAGSTKITEQEANVLLNPQKPLVDLKAQLVAEIDDAVAGIYQRFTRFESEYTLRESQAQAYKDAGYTGPVPEQVAAFATPAGLDAQTATDLILSQAANLRGALASLGVKRMRKYEVINAADAATTETKGDEILAEIEAIGDSLS